MQILFCIMQEICAIFRLDVQRMNPAFPFCISTCRMRNWTPYFPFVWKSKKCAFLYAKSHVPPALYCTFPTTLSHSFSELFWPFSFVWDSQETQLFPPNWHRILPARFRALASPFAVPKSSFAIPHFPPIIACPFSAPKRRKRGDRIASMCTHTTDTSSAYNPLRNRGFWMIFTLDSTPACRRSCPPQ